MEAIPVGYDFKETIFDFVDKNGKLKQKYICLPYMITLPLSQPTDPIPPPNTEPVTYKKSVISSFGTFDDWLSFVPVENQQPNIVTIHHNVLYFNNYEYNYDITIDVIKKGDDDVLLRLMAQNPYSLLASNMNDIYGQETVYDVVINKPINLTITGEYQFFYIHYPTNNFELKITISVSQQHAPIMICDKSENPCQCKECKKNRKKKKCICFEVDGKGYIVINGHDVPVYITKTLGTTTTKYLYPEFSYLRNLFYNVTLANSLPVPTSMPITTVNMINDNFNTTFYNTFYNNINNNINNVNVINSLTDIPDTILQCQLSNSPGLCLVPLWFTYSRISGYLVELSSSPVGCPYNQINELRGQKNFRYKWDDTDTLLTSSYIGDVALSVYLWHTGGWYEQRQYKLNYIKNSKPVNPTNLDNYLYYLPAGYFDNSTEYDWIAFKISKNDATNIAILQNTFNININLSPN